MLLYKKIIRIFGILFYCFSQNRQLAIKKEVFLQMCQQNDANPLYILLGDISSLAHVDMTLLLLKFHIMIIIVDDIEIFFPFCYLI